MNTRIMLREYGEWILNILVSFLTTQYACTIMGSTHIKKTFKTPFPEYNVQCRNEAVATDTVCSNIPAIDNVASMAQLYVGRESLVTDVFSMKTEKHFVNTLEDEICRRGAMDKLVSNQEQV